MPENKSNEIFIRAPDKKSWFSVVPSFGGRLTNLVLFHNQQQTVVLQPFENEAPKDRSYKNAFLIPFVNKIKDGSYSHENKRYQLAKNDLKQMHAAHGLIHSTSMNVREIGSAYIVLECSYSGDQPGYPFLFTTTIRYSIDSDKGFTCYVIVKNTGRCAMPLSVGWHPYFFLSEPVNNVRLKLPPCKWCLTDEDNIPTGFYVKNEGFTGLDEIGALELNNCYKTSATRPFTEISCQFSTSIIIIWQETRKFPFFQIYTPPDRKSIAIEPMSAAINSFNNKDGLVVLESGKKWEGSFGIKMLDENPKIE